MRQATTCDKKRSIDERVGCNRQPQIRRVKQSVDIADTGRILIKQKLSLSVNRGRFIIRTQRTLSVEQTISSERKTQAKRENKIQMRTN